MYESRMQAVLPRGQFFLRLAVHFLLLVVLLLGSILLGMSGYHVYERLPWLDAFLNTAMLLGGMGPVDAPQTPEGKLFAGFFALYAGLVFIVSAALMLTPLVHRVMHRFHWRAN